MTADYEGENIKWFSYYDSQSPENSIMIESAFEDGIKTEEKVYNQNFKVEKTLKAIQTSDGRQKLKVINSEGEKVMELENQW